VYTTLDDPLEVFDLIHPPRPLDRNGRGHLPDGVASKGSKPSRDRLQDVEDVTLIRHGCVRITHRRRGIGGRLLNDLRSQATRPLLVGTWAAAEWAIKFYRRHGFETVPRDPVPVLLRRYWSVPERQIETSVVLAEKAWLNRS
jgi:GNAT superfamily N-acetyltransferase